MNDLEQLLSEGDLRSIGENNKVVLAIHNQDEFDELFRMICSPNRVIAMRAIDAVEKVTISRPAYLSKYSTDILELLEKAEHKEIKWHLALLIPRLRLEQNELRQAWHMLVNWVECASNSRIVRVNALQSLYQITLAQPHYKKDLMHIITRLETENIPSISARIRKIKDHV